MLSFQKGLAYLNCMVFSPVVSRKRLSDVPELKDQIHIPEGINYDCQGCGICCSGWSVNMSEEDYKRVSSVDWGELSDLYKGKQMFRELKSHERAGTGYTHRIVSQDDTCPFLVNKLCFIHGQKGGPFKPTICQQFPYAFTETPSGIYATVSFVSMAVLYNQGTPLVEQRETINQKYADFKKLYPHYKGDWSKIQLATERPMSWQQYLKHEEELMKRLNDKTKALRERLLDCCDYLADELQAASSKDKTTQSQTKDSSAANASQPASALQLNKIDKHLLASFHKMYYPRRNYRALFNVPKFWLGVWFNTSTVFSISTANQSEVYAIDQLKEFPFPEDDPEMNDMLYRYIYSMLFGKKYFGAGFGHLTLITGFHHLIMSYALARLHARALAKLRQAPKVSLVDLAASLKQLETQMGEFIIGPSAASTLELLLQYPSRARRFLALL